MQDAPSSLPCNHALALLLSVVRHNTLICSMPQPAEAY
jgi:hypothetical protein